MRIRCGQGCGRVAPGWVASGILVLMICGSARAEEAVVYEPAPGEQIIVSDSATVSILRDGSGNVLETQVTLDKGE